MSKENGIPLTEACQKLGRRYHAVRDLILCGELNGWQDIDTRRWYADRESVERIVAGKGAAPPNAA
jgi:hypothetical protein